MRAARLLVYHKEQTHLKPAEIAHRARTFYMVPLVCLAAGLLISLVRKPEPKPVRKVDSAGRHTSLRSDIAEGLRYLLPGLAR